MDSQNRREHFRVEISVPVTWRALTEREIELLKKGLGLSLFRQVDLPGPIEEILAQTAPGSKEEKLYRSLQLINNKVDFLIDQIFLRDSAKPPVRDDLVEISGSGLKFTTREEIPPGTFLKIGVILPGTFLFQLELVAEAMRVEKMKDASLVAARIVEIDEAAKDAIIKVVFQKQREEIRRGKMIQEDHCAR